MHAKFWLLPPGKASSHSTGYPAFVFSCAVFSCLRLHPPAVRPTLVRQMDMGYLTCAQVCLRAVHTKGGGAVRHKQVCTRVDSEGHKTPHPHPSPRPTNVSNPGSSDLNSDSNHRATSPVNMHNDLSACCAHGGETAVGESARALTRKNCNNPSP